MYIIVENIKIKKGKEIGKGGFSVVYEGEKIDGSLVAIKW